MNKSEILEIKEEAKSYFLPFLLGSNAASHKLAKKIYRKHKITCYILDSKRSAADILDFSSKFLKLTSPKNEELTAKELLYLSRQSQYTLSILIPCSSYYEELVNCKREMLEASFVISNIKDALSASPLNVIPKI